MSQPSQRGQFLADETVLPMIYSRKTTIFPNPAKEKSKIVRGHLPHIQAINLQSILAKMDKYRYE